MKSYRRSNKQRGFVRFPVTDKRYKNSKEGGLFVRLVVPEKFGPRTDNWMVCCGGTNYVVMDEILLTNSYKGSLNSMKGLEANQRFTREQIQKHFPRYDTKLHSKKHVQNEYLSVGYLCAMTLGSTGWSGWSDKKESYWRCTLDDLTDNGRILVSVLKRLYPGHKVILQTWLDT